MAQNTSFEKFMKNEEDDKFVTVKFERNLSVAAVVCMSVATTLLVVFCCC